MALYCKRESLKDLAPKPIRRGVLITPLGEPLVLLNLTRRGHPEVLPSDILDVSAAPNSVLCGTCPDLGPIITVDVGPRTAF